MDHKISSENVKKVRTRFLESYNATNCTYLLSNKDINNNILSLINLLNTSSSNPNIEYQSPKNLTKDAINSAAKLFLYLNTCPNTTKKENILDFYKQIFKFWFEEPTNLGMILYILNAMRLSSNDERIIASHILEKVSTPLNFSFVQYQNNFEILKEDSIFGRYLQI